ncbi:hypothetical protein EYF80_009683 [Liparis tanakae]|uniref:Uncharacterized protein n=1 Tax=Liparis tanakae TaxID=230148 RepID=A0A4Z2IR72_9TELE|nr:hypothetical protein EYF80_009683 [Liparis tanakae]
MKCSAGRRPTVSFALQQPVHEADCVAASLDDDLWPAPDPGHPPEEAVRADQLVAVHQVVGPPHAGPQPGVGVVLDVGEGHLGSEGQAT